MPIMNERDIQYENQSEEDVLYIDKSWESAEACRLLRLSGLQFRTEFTSSHGTPMLDRGEVTYKELSGVESIVRGLNPEAFMRYLSGEDIEES